MGNGGVTLLPGIDDYPKKTEVTYLSEAQDVQYFARAHRLPLLSIWAMQRDNGRCPGKVGNTPAPASVWFSHLLESYLARCPGNLISRLCPLPGRPS